MDRPIVARPNRRVRVGELRGGAGDQALYDEATMEQLVAASLDSQRFLLLLFGIFAGLALLLACIGIYGVLSYLTSQRVPEIGVRMALGASAREVIRLILRQSLAMILIGIAAGLLGYLVSFVISRFRHLALIMLTLGFGLLLLELANSASSITGGADGLQGVKTWPLLGTFKFDLYGFTAYWYALIVLFLLFLVSRRLINSPFGLSLRGIRENAVRMRAIGAAAPPMR